MIEDIRRILSEVSSDSKVYRHLVMALRAAIREEKSRLDDLSNKYVLFRHHRYYDVAPPTLQPQLTPEELSLRDNGERIKAIKAVRTRLGCGLKEAIDIVDRY